MRNCFTLEFAEIRLTKMDVNLHFFYFPHYLRPILNVFFVSKSLGWYSFHCFRWTKTLILMDLRRKVDKFFQLPRQFAKFDETLTSIME